MGKLITLLLVLVVVAGGAYYFMNMASDEGADKQATNDKAPRVEEKYGFTSETAGS